MYKVKKNTLLSIGYEILTSISIGYIFVVVDLALSYSLMSYSVLIQHEKEADLKCIGVTPSSTNFYKNLLLYILGFGSKGVNYSDEGQTEDNSMLVAQYLQIKFAVLFGASVWMCLQAWILMSLLQISKTSSYYAIWGILRVLTTTIYFVAILVVMYLKFYSFEYNELVLLLVHLIYATYRVVTTFVVDLYVKKNIIISILNSYEI